MTLSWSTALAGLACWLAASAMGQAIVYVNGTTGDDGWQSGALHYRAAVYVNGTTGDDGWDGRWEVWDGGSCGPKATIQAGIDAAVDGDEVLIADGVYTAVGNRDLDFGGKAITVRSVSGNPAVCTIDCEGYGRGFYFHSGETTSSVVQRLTIRNGSSDLGGGVYCEGAGPLLADCVIAAGTADGGGGLACCGSDPVLSNCTITASLAGEGGAVYCEYSSPTLTSCVLSSSIASNNGGGLHLWESDPTLTDCVITGNTAGDGGGVYCWYSDPTLYDCTITANTAAAYPRGQGGGMYCDRSNPVLTDCSIAGNLSALDGGAVYGSQSNLVLTNCAVSDNAGGYYAGGDLYFWGGGVVCWASSATLDNCSICGNRTRVSGAAIAAKFGSAVSLSDCTITGNTARYGGGVYATDSVLALANCTLSGNTGSWGGGAYCSGASLTMAGCAITGNVGESYGGGLYCGSLSAVLTDCVIAGNEVTTRKGGGAYFSESTATLTNCTITGNTANETGGGLCCSHANVMLSNCILWADLPQEIGIHSGDNSTVTYCDVQGGWEGTGNIDVDPAFALPSDSHLMPGSPCIDAGTASPPGGLPAEDIESQPRAIDGDGDAQAVPDMGAYEFNPAGPAIALSVAELELCLPQGQTTARSLSIRNSAAGTLAWELECGDNWLTAEPASGQSSGETATITLAIDARFLTHGRYDGIITVDDPQATNSPRAISVVLYVSSTLYVPRAYPTIQAALNAAVFGDEVILADGAYTGSGNRELDFLGKQISLRSASGNPAACVIDCQQQGRGFCLHSGETPASALSGLTVRNGIGANGGGGIYFNYQSSPTLTNCLITGNRASGSRGDGGGVQCLNSGPTLTNCVITANTAARDGGGIYSLNSNPTLRNCTIVGNTAGADGGALCCEYGGDVRLTNCILWGDLPQEIYADWLAPSVSWSDVQGGCTGTGNIDANPLFVGLGNYHLSGSSPCIDAGDPEYATPPGAPDPDGLLRTWDGDGDGIARIDMGAFEYGSFRAGDLNCDDALNGYDIDPFVLALTTAPGFEGYQALYPGCEGMLADVNCDGSVNGFDIDPFVVMLVEG